MSDGPPTRSIVLLSVVVFLVGAPFAAYVGLSPAIAEDWSLSPAGSAALYSAYLVGSALVAGLVLPRIPSGSARLVRVGTVLVASAHLAFGGVPGPVAAALSRAIAGGAYILVYYGAVQWIAGATPRALRGRAIGAVVTAGYAGTSASYLLVAWALSAGLSWRLGYALLSVPGIAAAAAALLAFRDVPGRPERFERRGRDRVRWREVGGKRLGLVIAGYAVHTAELFVARFWVPYALVTVLVPAGPPSAGAAAWVLAGILFAAGVPSPLLGGWLGDRFGMARTASGVLAAGSLVAVLIPLSDGMPVVFVALSLFYCVLLPADSAALTSGVTLAAQPRWLGRAQSVQALAGFLAGAAVPALVGGLIDALPGVVAWKVALVSNGVIALAGSLLLVAVKEDPRSGADP